MGAGRSVIHIKSLCLTFMSYFYSFKDLHMFYINTHILPQVASSHADSFSFIRQGFKISIWKISVPAIFCNLGKLTFTVEHYYLLPCVSAA